MLLAAALTIVLASLMNPFRAESSGHNFKTRI